MGAEIMKAWRLSVLGVLALAGSACASNGSDTGSIGSGGGNGGGSSSSSSGGYVGDNADDASAGDDAPTASDDASTTTGGDASQAAPACAPSNCTGCCNILGM